MFKNIILYSFISLWLSSCSHIEKRKIDQDERFQLDQFAVVQNPQAQKYLQNQVQRICAIIAMKDCPQVRAVESQYAQAMAYYDQGLIYITRAMLYGVRNEAELFALLAHEVGHFFLRHGHDETGSRDAKNIEKITEVIGGVSGIEVPVAVKEKIIQINFAQYAQKNEQAADEFGVRTAFNLKYDPYALADLFERLALHEDKRARQTISLEASHKNLKDRAQHIRSFLSGQNIAKRDLLGEGAYLRQVSSLYKQGSVSVVEVAASKSIEILVSKLRTRNQKVSLEEFLSAMETLRDGLQKLEVLDDLENLIAIKNFEDGPGESGEEDLFMMEIVKILKPLWPHDQNLARALEILELLGRSSVGAFPVIGDAIDFYEVITGRDYFTDRPLSNEERMGSALGVIAGTGEHWRATARVLKQNISMPRDWKAKYRRLENKQSHESVSKLANDIEGKNIPDLWPSKATKRKGKPQGLEFTHPENNNISVRVMPGDPKSRFSNSREPYVRQTAGGKSYDRFGKEVEKNMEEAHIPLKDYKFIEFWKKK